MDVDNKISLDYFDFVVEGIWMLFICLINNIVNGVMNISIDDNNVFNKITI